MKRQYNQQIVGKNGCGLFACATAISNLWDYHLSNDELMDMYVSTGRVGNGGGAEKNQKEFLKWWNAKYPHMRSTFLEVDLLEKLEKIKQGMIAVVHIRWNTDRVIDWLDGDIDSIVKGRTQGWHAMCLTYSDREFRLTDNFLNVKPHNELVIPERIIIDSVNHPWELIGDKIRYPIKGKVLRIPK